MARFLQNTSARSRYAVGMALVSTSGASDSLEHVPAGARRQSSVQVGPHCNILFCVQEMMGSC